MAQALKLAEGLLLRKQLVQRLEALEPLKRQAEAGYFVSKVTRVNVTAGTPEKEGVDEVTQETPKITTKDIYAEHDMLATSLRKLDAKIQQVNWTADLDDYQPPESMK